METIQLIFGEDFQWRQWLFAMLLSMLGFIVFKLFTYNSRTESSTVFNPYYWWKDNRVEFYIGLILFYILMRFHSDLLDLLNEKFSFPLITNKYLYVFTFGLLFSMILKKGRKFFKIREESYADGQARSAHIGNRPDDR